MVGEYSKEQGEKLLKLARESIEEEFTGKKAKLPEGKKFNEKRGVFVTLTSKGKLRGCIGFPYPVLLLNEAVHKAAKSAAFSDPRFFPLKKEEMKDIEIEISILNIPEKCKPKEVEIGKDGLICNYSGYQGLLLPQVATENNFSREEFLECVCQKAGLPKDAHKKNGFELYKFQAQIFREK